METIKIVLELPLLSRELLHYHKTILMSKIRSKVRVHRHLREKLSHQVKRVSEHELFTNFSDNRVTSHGWYTDIPQCEDGEHEYNTKHGVIGILAAIVRHSLNVTWLYFFDHFSRHCSLVGCCVSCK